jgi:hypothetical protein
MADLTKPIVIPEHVTKLAELMKQSKEQGGQIIFSSRRRGGKTWALRLAMETHDVEFTIVKSKTN